MTRNPLERQSAEGMCAQLTLGHGAHELAVDLDALRIPDHGSQ